MKKRRLADLALTGLAAASALWAGYRTGQAAPVFADTLAGVGFELPFLTRLFLGIPPLIYLIVGVVSALVILAKEWLIESREKRLVINALAGLGALFFYSLFVSAMTEPLLEIMRQIHGVD